MKRLSLILTLTILGLVFLLPNTTTAQGVEDFVITKFSVDYYLTNEEAGGKLKTKEKIALNFSGNNHGILRAVPFKYKKWNTKIDVKSVKRDGKPEPYSTYISSDNLVLKIGDADKTITGVHNYEIEYEQKHVVNFDGPSPEFYWDINGTEWQQPFIKIEATVHLPYANGPTNNVCFSGIFGSTARDCKISMESQSIKFSSSREFFPGENLTLAIQLKDGYFKKPTPSDLIKDNIANIIAAGIGPLIAFGSFTVWLRRGKDYSGKGVIVPEYKPPKNITPGEFGLLADYRVDSRDITATLIDLAVRGYIKIHEEQNKILFMKNRKHSFELINPDQTGLKDHEKQLIDAIFPAKTEGEIVEVSKLSRTLMSSAIIKIRQQLQKDLTEKYGYFEKDAKRLGTIMIVAGSILFFSSFFLFFMPGLSIGGITGAVFLVLFGIIMPRRSHAGTEIYEQIQGLKLYMNTAEKDRLKMMQSVDRPYAEPSKTVNLYEKLLPFAVAVGVEKSWTEQFRNVLTETPDWYSGSHFSTFNSSVFASSLSGVNSSFGSSYASSSSSSGGSSGGGGGGGGGGGW